MATNTTNYGWTKPSYEDDADIMVINGTIDAIDAQVKTVENAIPTTLAELSGDSTHRTVTDTEKSTWNGKQSALSTAQLAAVNSGIDSTKVDQIETNKNNILYGYSALTSNLLNVADKTMMATGFVFQETPVSLKANTEYIFYVTIDSKAPMNLVGYTTGQSGRTVDISVTTMQQEIGINAIKFTPPANVDSMSLYINYQSTDITYSGMRITQEYSEIHLIQ